MSQEKVALFRALLREALPWLPPELGLRTFFALWDWRPMVAEARKHEPVLERKKQEARKACDRLLSYPPEKQARKVRWSRGRYLSAPLVHELIRRSREHIIDRPDEAVHLACLAREVALVLAQRPALCGGRAGVFDLTATAHAHAGNAFRVACCWEDAREAFAAAYDCLQRGSGDMLAAAEILSLHGSLLFERLQLDEAVAALRLSERTYQQLDLPRFRATVLIQLANALREKGELREAHAANLKACGLLDERKDPRLVVYAWHNQALTCVCMQAFEEAEEYLLKVPRLLGLFAAGMRERATFAWIQGRVDQGLGRPWRAEERYLEALGALEALGDRFDSALVRLDLAVLFLEENRLQEVYDAGEAACASLRSQQLHEDASRALGLLLEAVRRREVTAELVRGAAEAVRMRNLVHHAEPSNRLTR